GKMQKERSDRRDTRKRQKADPRGSAFLHFYFCILNCLVPPAAAAAVATPVAAATAVPAAAPRALFARPGLVDGQGAAHEVRPVHRGDGRFGPVAHLYEREPTRPAGRAF